MNNNHQTTKNKIYKVALDLFIKKGIKGTTTREIAKKAKIAEGTIYRHFKSKDSIAIELFENYMDQFCNKLVGKTDNSSKSASKIANLIDTFYEFSEKQPNACFFIVIGHYTELDKLQKEKLRLTKIFAKVIREGIKSKEFRNIDPNFASALIIGMINRSILYYNEGLLQYSYSIIISETKNAALRILLKSS